jgi:lysophospholipase
MGNSVSLMSKRALTPEKTTAIDAFWKKVTQATFIRTDEVKIAYATNCNRSGKPYIVIVPGRSESYLKYQELIYDLDQQGYDSVIIDHRGQGLSQRLLTNQFKGYVAEFDDYADDLQQLLNHVLPSLYPEKKHSPFMLAHSMGGAIALRYLQKHHNKVQSLVLSSPMIAISSGGTPNILAKFVVKVGTKINQLLSKTPWYFFGQNDVNKSTFAENILMHSEVRFQRFQALYQQQPELKLGGVTFSWLNQALVANKSLFNDLTKITQPTLMMQASEEHIVDNAAQDRFCQQLHKANHKACINGKPKIISGAYHELFFEVDEYRDIALDAAFSWFTTKH